MHCGCGAGRGCGERSFLEFVGEESDAESGMVLAAAVAMHINHRVSLEHLNTTTKKKHCFFFVAPCWAWTFIRLCEWLDQGVGDQGEFSPPPPALG